MLPESGRAERVRLLAPKTIAVMTSDQVPPGIAAWGTKTWRRRREMGHSSAGSRYARSEGIGHSRLGGDYFWAVRMGRIFGSIRRKALRS